MSDQEPVEGEVLETEADPLEILGKIAKYVAGYGAGAIVGQFIEANTSPKHIVQKVGMYVGGFALAGLAAHAAGKYAEEYVGEAVNTWREVSKRVTELQEELRKAKGIS